MHAADRADGRSSPLSPLAGNPTWPTTVSTHAPPRELGGAQGEERHALPGPAGSVAPDGHAEGHGGDDHTDPGDALPRAWHAWGEGAPSRPGWLGLLVHDEPSDGDGLVKGTGEMDGEGLVKDVWHRAADSQARGIGLGRHHDDAGLCEADPGLGDRGFPGQANTETTATIITDTAENGNTLQLKATGADSNALVAISDEGNGVRPTRSRPIADSTMAPRWPWIRIAYKAGAGSMKPSSSASR